MNRATILMCLGLTAPVFCSPAGAEDAGSQTTGAKEYYDQVSPTEDAPSAPSTEISTGVYTQQVGGLGVGIPEDPAPQTGKDPERLPVPDGILPATGFEDRV